MNMVDYWYDKGGLDKLSSQYPQHKDDTIISLCAVQIQIYESALVNRLKELEDEHEDD